MKEILSNTYGILVYQEQIMQLAQKLGGYSLGEADMMRRAMGKKNREEMVVHEEKFVKGAVHLGIKREKAEEIFNLMAQFADYGFNRSHSVAYAYLAYQTAYLKAHYPAYFYASVLSSESDDTAKIYKYSNELRNLGLMFLPPDINESDADFTPLDNAVRFGLTAIKGMGAASVHAIIEARKDGKFISLYDFVARVSQGGINRRALESLITAGAFDSTMPSGTQSNQWRANLFAGLESALSNSQKVWNDKLSGQNALFDNQENNQTILTPDLPNVIAWSPAEMANQEKAAVGFYLSNHPIDDFSTILSSLKIINIADYEAIKAGDKLTLAGIVSDQQVKYSKKGNRFCIFKLEDRSSSVKCLVWAEAYNKFSECLKNGELLIVQGKVESTEGREITIILEDAKKLVDIIPIKAKRMGLKIPKNSISEKDFEDLVSLLSRNNGGCEISIKIDIEDKLSVTMCSQALRLSGTSRLEQELKAKGCQVDWIL